MTHTTESDETTLQVGDFIRIPAWRVFGMVTAIESTDYGSDDAVFVALQESPNSSKVKWYHLEPGEYEVE